MNTLATVLHPGLTAVVRLLGAPALYLLLLLSLAPWIAAYQYKAVYRVDVGGLLDDAYVSGLHAKEMTPEFDYRWSTGYAAITFPEIGNEPVNVSISHVGAATDLAADVMTVTIRGQQFSVPSLPERRTDTFFVPRGDPWQASLTITVEAATFNEDPINNRGRDLGVNIDSVEVAPAEYGLRPVVVPAPGTLLTLAAGLLLFMLAVAVAAGRHFPALGAGVVLTVASTVLLLVARPELGLLVPSMLPMGAWCVAFAALARLALGLLIRDSSSAGRLAVALGSAAFVLAFALRFGGLTYPQFLTSDLLLNVHNVQALLGGEWIMSEPLPDGTPAPYPPALYAVVAPLTWVFGSGDEALSLILKWVCSVLDSLTCLALAWCGYRLWRGPYGGLAALVYAVSPAPFDLFSAGNYTNLFAQGVLNLGMLGGLAYLNGRSDTVKRNSWLLLSTGVCFFLTMLGHYGMMLGAFLIAFLFLLWMLVAHLRGLAPDRGWRLIRVFSFAAAVSFVAYYRNVVDLVGNHFGGLLGRVGEGQGGTASALSFSLEKLARKVVYLVGPAQLILALMGAVTGTRLKAVAWAWLGSWLAVGGLFALLDQALGDAIRWYYLVAAAVALLLGRLLGLLGQRGRLARWFVTLLLAAMTWHLLNTWVGDMIFYRYHTP
ncbi:MAG: hypothetical protein M3437_03525 [Chloroflexota bacterium]|nr:hypothetical protein [Chloroflexota bacterium]MDQ5866012.1 hypothetical protein [Chloroflexota bacterium]